LLKEIYIVMIRFMFLVYSAECSLFGAGRRVELKVQGELAVRWEWWRCYGGAWVCIVPLLPVQRFGTADASTFLPPPPHLATEPNHIHLVYNHPLSIPFCFSSSKVARTSSLYKITNMHDRLGQLSLLSFPGPVDKW